MSLKIGSTRFQKDLSTLLKQLVKDMPKEGSNKLALLREHLVNLQKRNVVKINHSVMELIVAKFLILKGYDVKIEYPLNDTLTCDLYATKGYGNAIIEIETGYIPPDHAMDPLTYTFARLASKIIRYSSFAGKFVIGVPPQYILPLPRSLALSPKRRTLEDIEHVKRLCDRYYQKPPVTFEEIRNARIQEIYIIDVDRTKVQEMDPESYMKRSLYKGIIFSSRDETLLEQMKSNKNYLREEERLDHYTKKQADL